MSGSEVRVALDLQDFGALVRGQEVRYAGVRIILRDIGWPLMLDEINNAAQEAGRRAAGAPGSYRNIAEETGDGPWHPGVERDDT